MEYIKLRKKVFRKLRKGSGMAADITVDELTVENVRNAGEKIVEVFVKTLISLRSAKPGKKVFRKLD